MCRSHRWIGRIVVVALLASVAACSRTSKVQDEDQLQEQITSYRAEGRFDRALETARQLTAVRRTSPNPTASRIEAALRLEGTLARICALPESSQAALASAEELTDEAIARYEEGDLESAHVLLERRLRIFERQLGSQEPDLAAAWRDLGDVSVGIGDSPRAAQEYRAALAIDQATLSPSHPVIADDISKLADLALWDGDLVVADSLSLQTKSMYEEDPGVESIEYATALQRLASIRSAQGDLGAGQALYQRALAIARAQEGGDPSTLVELTSDYAMLLHGLGDFAMAESLFQEAQVLDREQYGETSSEYAATLMNLAAVYQEEGRSMLAEPHYLSAAQILAADSLADREMLASCRANLAYTYTDLGEHGNAEPLYRDALEAFRDLYGDGDSRVATVTLNLARDLRQQGRYEESEQLYREALKTSRQALGPAHPVVGRCLYSYASLLDDQGRYGDAESLYARSAEIFEASRRRLNPGLGRATFQESPYLKLANTQLHLGRTARAWPAVERAQGRVLAEMLLAHGRPDLTTRETEVEDSLRGTLQECESQLGVFRAEASRDPSPENRGKVREARGKLIRAQASWSEFQQKLAERHPISEGEPFSLPRVQSNLAARAAIVGWVDVEERPGSFASWGYVIRPTGPVRWFRISPAEGPESPFEAARTWRRVLASPSSSMSDVSALAHSFWPRFRPLQEALQGVDQLIIVPTGAMLAIPVEAILDPSGEPVGSRFDVCYAPSATVFAWLTEHARSNQHHRTTALLVGDPPFNDQQLEQMVSTQGLRSAADAQASMPEHLEEGTAWRQGVDDPSMLGELPRLAGTRGEVQSVARCFQDATILLGPDAREERLAELAASDGLAGFSVVHLATHAFVDDRFPERSFLVLARTGLPNAVEAASRGERIYDGLLTAQEIVREWRLDADLVALSACETGLGKRIESEGYAGFAQALFQAGARSLLLTLWKVDDRASALLIGRFYENVTGSYQESRNGSIGTPMSRAAALREAKKWLRTLTTDGDRPYAHPFYWSSFVLVGDPSPLP